MCCTWPVGPDAVEGEDMEEKVEEGEEGEGKGEGGEEEGGVESDEDISDLDALLRKERERERKRKSQAEAEVSVWSFAACNSVLDDLFLHYSHLLYLFFPHLLPLSLSLSPPLLHPTLSPPSLPPSLLLSPSLNKMQMRTLID